jgi:transaldolase
MEELSTTMKIFLDTADVQAIKEGYATGLVDGITTNPTLIMKSGRDPEEVYQELIDLGIPDISMEVVGTGEEMVAEGRRLAEKFGKDQTTVKVPCTRGGLAACRVLSRDLIKVNVTLIFSQAQAILAAKAGATYVSPFVGRVDDNSFGGLCLVKDIANVYAKQNCKKTEVLAASLRGVRDVGRAFEYGANIVTMPPSVFDKMYMHVLTDAGLDQFNIDWSKVGLTAD